MNFDIDLLMMLGSRASDQECFCIAETLRSGQIAIGE